MVRPETGIPGRGEHWRCADHSDHAPLSAQTCAASGYLVLDFPKNLDVDSLLNGKLSFWFILSILSLNDRGLTGHCSQLQCFLDVTETMICKI